MAYFLLIVAGFIAGALTSMFGLGGALTVVPALVICLPLFHIPPTLVMHIALGTSLAIMFVNSLNSTFSHHRSGNINWSVYWGIVPLIALGTIIGSIIASILSTQLLFIVFLAFLVVIIVRFFLHLKQKKHASHKMETKDLQHPPMNGKIFYGVLSGIIGACLGGGSSLLMVPFLKRHGYLMKHGAALASALNVFIALVGTGSYIILGLHAPGLPKYSTGFVFWPAFLFILIGSFCGVPVGTRMVNKLNDKTSSIIYLCLILIIFMIMLEKFLSLR